MRVSLKFLSDSEAIGLNGPHFKNHCPGATFLNLGYIDILFCCNFFDFGLAWAVIESFTEPLASTHLSAVPSSVRCCSMSLIGKKCS